MCALVTYTVQLNLSLHVYFASDKIVLKCVKTHASRIPTTYVTENKETKFKFTLKPSIMSIFLPLLNISSCHSVL